MVLEKIIAESVQQLRDYELVTVFSPQIPEENLESVIDNISQFITGKGGTISEMQRWGKRRLAYPIKRFGEGHYVLTRFKFNPASGRELEAHLRISEDVLRHLLIKVGS